MKNLNLVFANTNGSGSQSAHNVLLKTMFRMGLGVGGKNLFPSNIAGLPTWYHLRLNNHGFTTFQNEADILVAMNNTTLAKDLDQLNPEGLVIYNSDFKFLPEDRLETLNTVGLPCRELLKELDIPLKFKKFATNMIYVGVLAHVLQLDEPLLQQTLQDHFKNKPDLYQMNADIVTAGFNFMKAHPCDYEVSATDFKVAPVAPDPLLMDGNTASALGLIYGGCSLLSWYPITPSSSVAENFQKYAKELRKDKEDQNKFAVIQAEDELSAFSMVLGAGWTGVRAVTPTSGPGLSLMAEGVGLSYFAEVPTVLWDVQRAGPSTGLPTRTLQGDVLSAAHLSHGDTEHLVLIPGTPEECFEFGQTCFDLAEQFQTPVIVLSDLDLGMNQWTTAPFKPLKSSYQRGKVLDKQALEKHIQKYKTYARYKDHDGDGIGYRTLVGTAHPEAAYFTRGTGHDEAAKYSEHPQNFEDQLNRIQQKIHKAIPHLPSPILTKQKGASIGLITYGSTHSAVSEVEHILREQDLIVDTLRLRSLPLCEDVDVFIKKHSLNFVVEQNRDGQMHSLILKKFRSQNTVSIAECRGTPIEAQRIVNKIIKHQGGDRV